MMRLLGLPGRHDARFMGPLMMGAARGVLIARVVLKRLYRFIAESPNELQA